MVNLKSASLVLIMLLHEGLTRMHSQKEPKLHFGESFTLSEFLKRQKSKFKNNLFCPFLNAFFCSLPLGYSAV